MNTTNGTTRILDSSDADLEEPFESDFLSAQQPVDSVDWDFMEPSDCDEDMLMDFEDTRPSTPLLVRNGLLQPSLLERHHIDSDNLNPCYVPNPDEDNLDSDGDNPDEEIYDDADDEGNNRDSSIAYLEDFVLDFLLQLSASLPDPKNPKSNQNAQRKIVLEVADRRKPPKADGSTSTRAIKFPQKGRGSSSKTLAQTLRVVDLMHEALVDDMPTTKRDMYYKDVPLLKSQAVVDKLVDDFAATFKLTRADLHVRASSKGLFCGAGLVINLCGGEIVRGNHSESVLIPVAEDIGRFEVDDALAWVLVVEKEAVFQTLVRLQFSNSPALPGPGIIITGKGYPDVATRQLVCTLSDNLPPHIPILAIVDSDPFGIDILSVYKYGSDSMAHERETLAAPRIKWAGVFSSELSGFGVDLDSMIPITKHDEKKALSMLSRRHLPRKWKKELQHMLFIRRKAEIEILSTINSRTATQADLALDNPELKLSTLAGDGCPLATYLTAIIRRAVIDSVNSA